MKIIIREIKEIDFKRLIELFIEFAAFEKMTDKMTNSLAKMLDEKKYFRGFVAETEDKLIVGYATFFFCYYTWTGKSLYMDDLYVQPDFRNKGIGTQLLNKVISQAKDTHCNKLRWQVSNWNKSAIDFYKKKGAIIDTIEQNCDLIFT